MKRENCNSKTAWMSARETNKGQICSVLDLQLIFRSECREMDMTAFDGSNFSKIARIANIARIDK